ncbi:LysR substrate-binding domain-containing protein [Paucibacter sp. PLA-PC-4]|uniref:LysR substrate-binding domain-containing protein n=1 Tax=Paucibacter sp. PLA-PC-4 TaxID=2993655 RepID=UPI002249A01E|nr:LysR substrate-binding domain-containing protein [Paucibacter sp. PLA-PC-4]MCX2860416.1 LysR substrate-binding domain-containing protein [Paucibacter sp. PLA-PC-4]
MAVQPPSPRLPPFLALRAFEAAARHQSFARAAQELCVTPAAVAAQVKALEQWLGAPLFERHSQGLSLRTQAAAAVPALAAAMDQLGQAVQTLRSEAGAARLHIAALPALAQLWLTPLLPALQRELPGLQLSLSALEVPPNFQREAYDLGLFYAQALPRKPPPKGCQRLVLAEDALLPVCSPSLLGLRGRAPELADQILLHDIVWSQDWVRWLKSTGRGAIAMRDGPRFSLYSMALQAALAGQGVLMGRQRLVAAALAEGSLVAPWGAPVPLAETITLLIPSPRAGQDLTLRLVAALQRLGGTVAMRR